MDIQHVNLHTGQRLDLTPDVAQVTTIAYVAGGPVTAHVGDEARQLGTPVVKPGPRFTYFEGPEGKGEPLDPGPLSLEAGEVGAGVTITMEGTQ